MKNSNYIDYEQMSTEMMNSKYNNIGISKKQKNGIDKGLMKREYCESHLLEIREYSHRMDKLRNETIKKIEDDFNTLIKALKNRKTVLMTELLDIFSKESEEIENDESKWTVNQDVSDKVLSLSKDPNDATILLNAKFIMDVIKDLNVDEQFKEIKIFNVIDTSLTLSPNTVLSYEEILFHLKNFMTILEPNNLEFRA